MFSKSKINDPAPKDEAAKPAKPEAPAATIPASTRAKPAASILSADLNIKGNIKTTGDIQIEGAVDGDIRAHLLTIGETATVRGEVTADDVVINGRIVGRVRGLKVRLTSTARVEGDIIHKTIAIESGAHFEGSVQRQDDPISGGAKAIPAKAAAAAPSAPKPAASAPVASKPTEPKVEKAAQ